MKKINFLVIAFLSVFLIYSCQDNLLETNIDPENLNDPTLNGTVTTVTGMESYAKGAYLHTTTRSWHFWFVYGYHETMGDNLTMPWGNFGGRWVNQTSSIVLDDGSTVTPPAGGPQPGEIDVRNTRAAGSDNATQFEWADMYALNDQCNNIISNLDNITDATASQKDAFNAWALWWKAYAYNRLGLLYEEGVIVDTPGTTNGDFLPSEDLIAESDRLLGVLDGVINGTADQTAFNAILANLQIDIVGNNIDADGLIRNSNMLKARNLVYSTSVATMSAGDWGNVITWCNNGITDNTQAFIMKSESTVLDNSWLPGAVSGFWYFPSPRLIQDINAGDARLNSYFDPFVFPNPRGRGIQYGCNYFWKDESGIASSTAGAVDMYYAGSYEENQLLLAEAKIRTNDIDGGLTHVDNARAFQNAGLAAMSGTGLTQEEALEEVRKERRIGLIMRSVAFYDARRYGVAAGSRTGAHVLDAGGNLNTNATINYGYLEYWPVPAFESDFNSPGTQN